MKNICFILILHKFSIPIPNKSQTFVELRPSLFFFSFFFYAFCILAAKCFTCNLIPNAVIFMNMVTWITAGVNIVYLPHKNILFLPLLGKIVPNLALIEWDANDCKSAVSHTSNGTTFSSTI